MVDLVDLESRFGRFGRFGKSTKIYRNLPKSTLIYFSKFPLFPPLFSPSFLKILSPFPKIPPRPKIFQKSSSRGGKGQTDEASPRHRRFSQNPYPYPLSRIPCPLSPIPLPYPYPLSRIPYPAFPIPHSLFPYPAFPIPLRLGRLG